MAEQPAPQDESVTCCQDDKCKKTRDEIDQRINRNKHELDNKGIHGLKHQFRELKSNIDRGNFSRAQTHLDQIWGNQSKLAALLRKLKDDDCGDPPAGAWSWAERSTKEFEDAIANQGPSAMQTAGMVVAGAGIGYAAYRIVRMLPSLFPALWWTVPANLAVP